jgi:pilus assembly protein CpaF
MSEASSIGGGPSGGWRSGATAPAQTEPQKPWSDTAQTVIREIERALLDETITEVHGYGPNRFSVKRNNTNIPFRPGFQFADEEEYERWIREQIEKAGAATSWREIEKRRKGVVNLKTGERFTVFLPVFSHFAKFSIRKHTSANWEPAEFVEREMMTSPMLKFLLACVAARVNILFAGPMGAGKTSVMRALIEHGTSDSERIAAIEEVPELFLTKPLADSYFYQEEVDGMGLSDVIDTALFHSLDRLIIGEIHTKGLGKALDAMQRLGGGMFTFHARTAQQAGSIMALNLQRDHGNMDRATAAESIRTSVELIVVLDRVEGVPRVVEITEIDHRQSGGAGVLTGTQLFHYDRALSRHVSENRPDPSGRIMQRCRDDFGIDVPTSWFGDIDEVARRIRESA